MAKLIKIEKNETKRDVYDITVEDNHNFVANGILISNCAEITLESFELCNLVEIFPSMHESLEEFKETLKYAYLYAKSITLVNTKSPETNAVMLKNRRIGVSMTGIIDAMKKHGKRTFLKQWCDNGYNELQYWDKTYSDWLCVPLSKKITTVKPSGCTDLSTTIKTTDGIKSMSQLFEENGIEVYNDMDKQWFDIEKDIYVYDKNNEEQKISKLYVNGVSDVYEFQTEDGEYHYFTAEHKFLVKDKGWVRVDELEIDDDIISF